MKSTTPFISFSTSIGGCMVATLLAFALFSHVELSNIILLYVLAVVVVAAVAGKGPGILCSVISVACFDFFFVPPRFSFAVESNQYLITFAAMLIVSLIISYITSAYREKAIEADRRADDSAFLAELAHSLSGALSPEQIATSLNETMAKHSKAQSAIFLVDAQSHLVPVATQPQSAAAVAANSLELLAAQGVFNSGQPVMADYAMKDQAVTTLLPMDGSAGRLGVLAIHFPDFQTPLPTSMYLALAALITTTVERMRYAQEVLHPKPGSVSGGTVIDHTLGV